jgi:hypothetical protein
MKILHKMSMFLIFLSAIVFEKGYGQESWIINDMDFNGLFIEAYNEALFNTNEDASEDDIILEDNFLVVDKNDEIIDITASGDDGAKILNQDLINQLPNDLMNKLKKRKYDWDHLDWRKFSFQILGRNAYEYANFKEIRDANYWSRNVYTMTPFTFLNSFILRPDPGLLALIFEQGYSDIGYPSTLSENTRMFIATETAKVFLNLPTTLPSISVSKAHPLERTYGGGIIFNVDNIGGMVGYNILNDINYNDAYDPNNTIYNNWAGQLYWTKAFKFKIPVKGKNSKDHSRIKPLFPDGVQRIKFGPSYAKLTYGRVDTLSVFKELESSDFGNSFSIFFEWSYLSDKIQPEGSYNYYHEWSIYFRANVAESASRLNTGFLYSLSAGFAVGANIVWASPVTFLVGDVNEFKWDPGYVISPNLTFRW